MKITDIKTYPIWVGTRNQLVVKVETDEGIVGWGESGLSGREQAVVGAIRHYRELLIGRDPMRIGALWQEMYRSQYFEGGRVLTAAHAALDLAFYDVAGKALGVPVYQLLGGRQREWIPCFASTTAPLGPQLVEQMKLLADRGWPAIRQGFTRATPRARMTPLRAARSRLGRRPHGWRRRGPPSDQGRCWASITTTV